MLKTQKAERTHRHILDTGYDLVLSKGFSAVGLSELLTACAVPKGSFYHYFESKERFGVALIEHYVTLYRTRLDELLDPATSDGRTLLLRYFSAWIDDPGIRTGWAERCLMVKLAAEIADLSEDMRLTLSEGVTQLQKRLRNLVRQGIADGSLRSDLDPMATATLLYQMWLGAGLMARLEKNKAPLHRALEATTIILATKPQ